MHPTIEKDETIHEAHLFSVHRLKLRMDDGQLVERDLVRHPGAALVMPILPDGRVVMIRQYRFAVDEQLWELPCGTLDDGEEPARCAHRELKEETGYSAGRMEKLGSFYSCPGYDTEEIHAFLAEDLTDGHPDTEPYEDIAVEPVALDRLREMMATGEITDSKTLATLGMYFAREQG
jgi:ADP-ribose pyrophosphatase